MKLKWCTRKEVRDAGIADDDGSVIVGGEFLAGGGDGFVVFGAIVGNSGEGRVLVLGFKGGFRFRGFGFGEFWRVFGNWDWWRWRWWWWVVVVVV